MASSEQRMEGKVCLVTGATGGIGLALAAGLAREGAEVVLVGRDPAKGQRALDEIRGSTGSDRVALLLADLSSQRSIRELAGEVLGRFPQLHVLVNNAGALNTVRKVTEDGLEQTFAVNHLAYFLLTTLLLDRLRASAPARVVSTSSAAHRGARLDFGDLQLERGFRPFRAYARSKLANILFTRELARRTQGSGVTANCFHPGVVRSGFGQNDAGLVALGVRLLGPLMRSPEKAALTGLDLACDPKLASVTGRYFQNRHEARPYRAAQDDAAARRLWEVSEALCGPRA